MVALLFSEVLSLSFSFSISPPFLSLSLSLSLSSSAVHRPLLSLQHVRRWRQRRRCYQPWLIHRLRWRPLANGGLHRRRAESTVHRHWRIQPCLQVHFSTQVLCMLTRLPLLTKPTMKIPKKCVSFSPRLLQTPTTLPLHLTAWISTSLFHSLSCFTFTFSIESFEENIILFSLPPPPPSKLFSILLLQVFQLIKLTIIFPFEKLVWKRSCARKGNVLTVNPEYFVRTKSSYP